MFQPSDYASFTQNNPPLTTIYYIALSAAFTIFLLNLLIATYAESYGRIRNESRNQMKLHQAELIIIEAGFRKLPKHLYTWNSNHALYVKGNLPKNMFFFRSF